MRFFRFQIFLQQQLQIQQQQQQQQAQQRLAQEREQQRLQRQKQNLEAFQQQMANQGRGNYHKIWATRTKTVSTPASVLDRPLSVRWKS